MFKVILRDGRTKEFTEEETAVNYANACGGRVEGSAKKETPKKKKEEEKEDK